MTKPDLYRLVDCKRKRGKMRPILRLIESNDADFIVSTTTTAFSSPDVQSSFTHLLSIKGVGPATASYVLAAHKPSEAPVFSDEAFRWVVHNGAWNTKINYDAKEYWDYYDKVGVIAKRLGLENKEDVERVGFVLGQEAAAASAVGKGNVASKGRKPVESKKRKSTAVAEMGSEETERNKEQKKLRPQEKRAIDPATITGTTRSGRVLRSRKPAAE
ncbi:hypothetical protein K440DRAFT_631961 [Wilcoxina mikolae CBS 423.85]|nr:hypothetical protein K440DRAFT_631961 [Wilcoxina mikolae CBS 423.85]